MSSRKYRGKGGTPDCLMGMGIVKIKDLITSVQGLSEIQNSKSLYRGFGRNNKQDLALSSLWDLVCFMEDSSHEQCRRMEKETR